MSNTSNRIVIIGDGEGADHTDMNRLSIWQDILANDYKFAMLTRTDPDVATPWQESTFTKKLHRFHNAGCAYAGPSNRQIKSKRGLIAKWIAAPDGSEPKLLCYFLDEDEIDLTSPTADATNPRYDVVAVKLEWEDVSETRDYEDAGTHAITSTSQVTHKRVKMTARIVAGTPAASPTRPAIASDEAYYAVYKIPATFNTTLSLDPSGTNEFVDYTFPIGELKTRYLQGSELMHIPADWAVAADGTMQSSASNKIAKAGVPLVAGEAKILKVEIGVNDVTSFQYGIHGSTSETFYASIGALTKNFADFSSIDQHTCKAWFRKNAFTSNPRQPAIKITSNSSSTVLGQVEIHYK